MQIPKLNRTPGQPQVVWEHKAKWLKWPSSYCWWFQQCLLQLNNQTQGPQGWELTFTGLTEDTLQGLCQLFPFLLSLLEHKARQCLPNMSHQSKGWIGNSSRVLVLRSQFFLYTKVQLYPYNCYLSTITKIKFSGKANSNDTRYPAVNSGCLR